MEYNTQLNKLRLPEYGRNVQKMVDHLKTIEDKAERNRAADTVIQVMGFLNPSLKENRDFKHKLWDHIHMIGEFELDIDAPYPAPSSEQFATKPARIPYPQSPIQIQHYGKNIERLIQKAFEMPEGDKKNEFVRQIANHMKMSYLTWNKDSVNDQVIIETLKELSKGVLVLPPDTVLADIKELPAKTVPLKRKKTKSYKSK